MNNTELVDVLKQECRRVKMQRNAYEQKLLDMAKKLYKAEVELELMKKDNSSKWKKAPKLTDTVIPDIKQEYIPDVRAEKKQVIFNTVWPDWVNKHPDIQSIDPPGKWTLPEDHPDNGGPLAYPQGKAWSEIYRLWAYDDNEKDFAVYLNKYYNPPKRGILPNWARVQNWARSLADYKDTPFLDFLIKFYPAPDLKK